MPTHRDGSVAMDAGDGGSRDGALDAARDAGADASDAGRGDAGQCETCAMDIDCQPDMYCAPVPGGRACFAVCNFEMPTCPRGFQCVDDHSATPAPVCAPVGTNCCVDPDGDLYGSGVGCMGTDCDETSTNASAVHPGAAEACDGVDQNCDGVVDEGDPAVLCPPGAHVQTTNCASGACTIATCEPTFADCNATTSDGCETNIDTPTDCGSCGAACDLPHSTSPMCNHGVCAIGLCDAGYGDCDANPLNGCETPLNTATHCGTCTSTCNLPNASTSCDTGSCEVVLCDHNWGDCNGRATDGCETPLVTTANCGTCGTACEPPTGTGTCSTGTCRVTTCASGYDDCDMMSTNGCETNVRTLSNCGACGLACGFPNGNASCAAGACTLVDCVPGYGNCDGITTNGCETRTNTLASCGTCGAVCAPANAMGTCTTGTCAIAACNPGYGDCDGLAANGCETPLNTTTNCGACRTACTRPGAVADCSTGMCDIGMCLATTGNCDGNDTNGCETSIRTLSDCGGCAVTCTRANATPTCASGTCSVSSCNAGFANCDGIDGNGCEQSLSTTSSCGGCGMTCARANATSDCSTGSCHIAACNAGWGDCDGVDANGCETPLTTLTNCGSCRTTCSRTNASATCVTGACEVVACTAAYGDCDGNDANGCETSIRTLTDCGGCAMTCGFTNAGASCSSGTCTLGACTSGYGNCDGNAANGCETPLTTTSNCGGCGTMCSFANGTPACTGGSCTLMSCSSTYGNCDMIASNGCETSLRTLTDCGACGAACSFSNAGASCSAAGVCTLGTCNAGYGNCDGMAANGCETPLNTTGNCGACGTSCTSNHGTPVCSAGSCGLGSCDTGYGNCDGSAGNGCETQLNTLANCGGCGTQCNLANATSSCSTGTCAISSCNAGFANCDGIASNGCETPLNTLTNCGSCGATCTVMSGTPTCATGTCQVSGCASGFADCDGNSGNGCETNTHTTANCGGCGTMCSLANASSSCSTGTCAISSCNAGWANCDGNAANGCETPLNSVANCGACGMSCSFPNSTPACVAMTCAIGSCNAGTGNCDGNTSNGCETNTNTSASNCGSCGNVCNLAHATAACTGGSCTIASCAAGYGNCDGNATNGCETQLNSLTNCGGCGVGCSRVNATATCSSGSCAISSCNSLYGNCDGTDSNGCETSLTSTTNCAGCGTMCSPAHATGTCTTGTCAVAMCNASYYDVNASGGDGCECLDDSSASSCSGATNLGNQTTGGTAINASGVIPQNTLADWYTVTFTGSNSGAPTIGFTASGNPGGVFRFDVFVGTCTTGSSCTSPEAATGLTSWEFRNSFNGSSNPVGGQFTQPVTWPTTVFIRVSRTSSGLSCASYTLQITRP